MKSGMLPPGRGREGGQVLGLLLLLFLVINAQDLSEVISAASGTNVTLQLSQHLLGSYSQLTWFFNTQQKIVEWDSPESYKYYDSLLKSRVKLDLQSPAHLHIYMVQKSDSSTYLLRVLQNSGEEQEWRIPLQVFDPVPKPVINIKETEEMEGNCHLNLLCVVQDDQSVNYVWYGDSGPFPEELHGSTLAITLTPQNQSKFYTCQASNPVSSKNSTVYFTPPCTLAQSSGVSCSARWLMIIPSVFYLLLIQ